MARRLDEMSNDEINGIFRDLAEVARREGILALQPVAAAAFLAELESGTSPVFLANSAFIGAFLTHLENKRGNSARTRNVRLAAIHSFFRYAAFELPEHAAQIQRVLAIPSKRFTRALVRFLTRAEVDALLGAPDQDTWFGRRDHAFILMAVQTGLRLSEITGVTCDDLVLETGAHVRVVGKGRKERRRLALEALEMVGLADRWHHQSNELSGGPRGKLPSVLPAAGQ